MPVPVPQTPSEALAIVLRIDPEFEDRHSRMAMGDVLAATCLELEDNGDSSEASAYFLLARLFYLSLNPLPN